MKDWEYTFDPVSKATWIQQIEADLKGKAATSLQSEWWEGEPLNPILHREDVGQESVRLPDTLFKQPPTIAEWIESASLSAIDVNKKILEALQFGAESIIIHPENTKDHFDKGWIKDVVLDIISLQIQLDSFPSIDSIKQLPAQISIRINRIDAADTFSDFIEKINFTGSTIQDRIRFVYRFQSKGNWIQVAADQFNILLQDLEIWKKRGLSPLSFIEKCILCLDADQNYFKQIIQTRVMHLVWQNLLHLYHDDGFFQVPYLESHIHPSSGEKPDHFLIRASMSSLAAALGGTHTLCIHHSENSEIPDFYKRIDRNIHHLLNFESGMYKGTDPMAGAYTIDFYTRKWTQDICEKLVLVNGQSSEYSH